MQSEVQGAENGQEL